MKPLLLILSFSNISQDARVLKQVRLFRDEYRVVTCGEGPTPKGVAEHLQLPGSGEGLPRGRFGLTLFGLSFSALQLLRLFPLAYWLAPQIRSARRLLRGRNFDAILCDDIQPLPLLARVAPSVRVHADVHEYFPGLHDQDPRWRLLWLPYYRWMIRRYLTGVASITTVTETIARRYEQEFGLRHCGVVVNAAPYQELAISSVGETIRVVHSGAAIANRQIEQMMVAVAEAGQRFTLDLYLLPSEPGYFAELQALAGALGERITVHSAVPQQDLVRTLNAYDIGITVLAATNTNNVLALPNKFFDYIQARLGILTSPSPEMERILRTEDLGLVTATAETPAILETLKSLDPATVVRWKSNAAACARSYSAEVASDAWASAIRALVE